MSDALGISTEYTYDNISNMLSMKDGRGKITNYNYGAFGVLLSNTNAENRTISYKYDLALNKTQMLDRNGNETLFSYDSRILFNGHGDVVHTVSEAGVVENNYEYDIFGTPTLTIEQYPCAIRYAGEFYDSETGLYYLRARYYDCYIARFISEDTYRGKANDPLSLNLYTYCHNEPVMYIDPTGHTDAYLTDLAKASKGTVVWDSKNKVAVVTVNSVKKELKVSDYKNSNGKIVIDNNQFDAMFTKTYKDTSYKSTIDTTVKNGQITATQYVKDSKVTVQTKTLSSITSTYIPTYNLSGNANQGAGNAKISKPDNIKQSGGAIAPTMAPPKAIPIPNPFLLAAEIIVINLFTPTVVSGGDLTPEQVLQDKLIEKARVDALTITEETNPDRGTTIYRYTNKYDRQSLTPAPADAIVVRKGIPQAKGVDDFTLSFSTNPDAGWVTTVEAVNSTGYLIAIQDTTNHVSIIPNPEVESIYGTMKDWRDSYNNANTEPHFYTKILNAISTRIK